MVFSDFFVYFKYSDCVSVKGKTLRATLPAKLKSWKTSTVLATCRGFLVQTTWRALKSLLEHWLEYVIYIYICNIELYKLTCNAFGVAALRWREWVEASQRWCIQKTRSSRNLHGGVCIWLPFGMHRLHCAHFCDMQFVPRCNEGHLFAMIASPEWRTEQI